MSWRLTFVLGTRPEAVKLAPVILQAQQDPDFDVEVIFTGQHDELARGAIEFFDMPIHKRLTMMNAGQSLSMLLSRGMQQLDETFDDGEERHVVLAQGDTTTVLAAGLVAFSRRIAFAHVEAGLRSGDMTQPFPEEANRQLATRVAKWHFAPTEQSCKNLAAEGISPTQIIETGNTVVDAVHLARTRLQDPQVEKKLSTELDELGLHADCFKRFILVTAHRRENFGQGMLNICRSIRELALEHPDLHFVWPVHRNPSVLDVAHAELGNLERVHLLPPVDYPTLMLLMDRAQFALTDSGGIQEESPSFHKPVLILRNTTERPEVITAGVGKLVGTDVNTIKQAANTLLSDSEAYAEMASGSNPFGDGKASQRILERIKQDLAAGR